MSIRKIFKGCEPIDRPTHRTINEILEILELFCEWRVETKNEKNNFLPWQTFGDLYHLVMGIVGVSTTFLKENGSNFLVKRRSGSVDVENKIAGVREKYKANSIGCLSKYC